MIPNAVLADIGSENHNESAISGLTSTMIAGFGSLGPKGWSVLGPPGGFGRPMPSRPLKSRLHAARVVPTSKQVCGSKLGQCLDGMVVSG